MNQKSVDFSIIIPTYNRAELLGKCLNSLVQQTFKNFEVIVCDDGSSDNSRQVVESFKPKLDIKYFYEENWGGPARPRNNGLRLASGDWVAFLDSDDFWESKKLETVARYLDQADVIYHRMIVLDEKDRQISAINSKHINLPVFNNLLIEGNRIPLSSVVCRKSKVLEVGGFSEDRNLISVEDFDLWLKLSRAGCRFCFVPEFLGYYYAGGGNISQASERQIKRLRAIYLRHLPFIVEKSERKRVLASYYYQKFRMLFMIKKDISHYSVLKKAFYLSSIKGKSKIVIVFFVEFFNLIKFYRKILLLLSLKWGSRKS